MASKRAREEEKEEREAGDDLGHQAAADVATKRFKNALINAPPADPSVRSKARVTVNDETLYIPRGFERSAEGYEAYVNTAGDLAKAIYKRPGDMSRLRPDVGGYKYRSLSDSPAYGVWVNEETKHAFVVFKGTDTGAEWALQNTYIATGGVRKNREFQDAYEFYKFARAELAAEGITIDVTGHSLGGAKAMYVAAIAEDDLRAASAIGRVPVQPHSITFNPGMGPGIREKISAKLDDLRNVSPEFRTKYLRYPSKDYNLIVRNNDDLVSAFYPRGKSNVITFDNYQQGDGLGDVGWSIKQHSINQFTTENNPATEGTLKSALGKALTREQPYQAAARLEDVISSRGAPTPSSSSVARPPRTSAPEEGSSLLSIPKSGYGSVDDVAVGAAEEGFTEAGRGEMLAAGAEAVASTMFLPVEMLNLMTLQQQMAELGEYMNDREKVRQAGMWGAVSELGTSTPNFGDYIFESEEQRKREYDQKNEDALLEFYNQTLPYSPALFDTKVEYQHYLQDRALGKASWQQNFSIIAKNYQKFQRHDQREMDAYNARYPTDKKSEINPQYTDSYALGKEWSTQGGSGTFMGMDLSVQDMGVVLARQFAILRNSELKKMGWSKAVAESSGAHISNIRLQHDKDLDYDALRSVSAAVARKEYVAQYFKEHMDTDSSGNAVYREDAAALYGYDRRDIPTYDAAYYAYVDDHAKLGGRRDMDDLVQNHNFYNALRAYKGDLADGVYGYDPKTGALHFYDGDDLLIQDAIDNTALGWTFFEKSANNQFTYAPTPEIERQFVSVFGHDDLRKYVGISNKPRKTQPASDWKVVTPEMPELSDEEKFAHQYGGRDLRYGVDPVTGDIFAPQIMGGEAMRDFTGGAVNPRIRTAYREWLKKHTPIQPAMDPDNHLRPGHGPQGNVDPPSVTPRSDDTHHPPGQPNSDSIHPNFETRDRTPSTWADMAHVHDGDFEAADQLNHDANNPIHHDSSSISANSESQALHNMIHSRSFGTSSDMASTGMNFAGLVMVADMRGQAAEKTSNALAD